MTGTTKATLAAFWKVSTSRTVDPPLRGRIRSWSTTFGVGPVRNTAFWLASPTAPPGRLTRRAVPGAVMLTSRSGEPVLTRARKSPADWPVRIAWPTGAPSTKAFLIAMLLNTAPAPSVG
jgi:hypothetical protein